MPHFSTRHILPNLTMQRQYMFPYTILDSLLHNITLPNLTQPFHHFTTLPPYYLPTTPHYSTSIHHPTESHHTILTKPHHPTFFPPHYKLPIFFVGPNINHSAVPHTDKIFDYYKSMFFLSTKIVTE